MSTTSMPSVWRMRKRALQEELEHVHGAISTDMATLNVRQLRDAVRAARQVQQQQADDEAEHKHHASDHTSDDDNDADSNTDSDIDSDQEPSPVPVTADVVRTAAALLANTTTARMDVEEPLPEWRRDEDDSESMSSEDDDDDDKDRPHVPLPAATLRGVGKLATAIHTGLARTQSKRLQALQQLQSTVARLSTKIDELQQQQEAVGDRGSKWWVRIASSWNATQRQLWAHRWEALQSVLLSLRRSLAWVLSTPHLVELQGILAAIETDVVAPWATLATLSVETPRHEAETLLVDAGLAMDALVESGERMERALCDARGREIAPPRTWAETFVHLPRKAWAAFQAMTTHVTGEMVEHTVRVVGALTILLSAGTHLVAPSVAATAPAVGGNACAGLPYWAQALCAVHIHVGNPIWSTLSSWWTNAASHGAAASASVGSSLAGTLQTSTASWTSLMMYLPKLLGRGVLAILQEVLSWVASLLSDSLFVVTLLGVAWLLAWYIFPMFVSIGIEWARTLRDTLWGAPSAAPRARPRDNATLQWQLDKDALVCRPVHAPLPHLGPVFSYRFMCEWTARYRRWRRPSSTEEGHVDAGVGGAGSST